MVIYTTSDFSVFIDKGEWIFFNERPWNGIAGLEYVPSKFQKKLQLKIQIVRDFLHLLLMKTVNLYSANTIYYFLVISIPDERPLQCLQVSPKVENQCPLPCFKNLISRNLKWSIYPVLVSKCDYCSMWLIAPTTEQPLNRLLFLTG